MTEEYKRKMREARELAAVAAEQEQAAGVGKPR